MNFYPMHIGDYASHTMHLEPIEDLAYRRMIDLYYMTESPLPLDASDVARLIRLKTHVLKIENVLSEFFNKCDDGWHHSRCDYEIEKYAEKREKARKSGVESGKARKENKEKVESKNERTLNERSANVERIANECGTDAELPIPIPIPIPIP